MSRSISRREWTGFATRRIGQKLFGLRSCLLSLPTNPAKERRCANYGRERGRLWASEKAEYVELRRVVDLAGVHDKEALGSLMSAIDPQNKLDRIEFADLIGVEERDMSNEYAVAFVEGATEVYDQVAIQLQEISPGQSDDLASLLLAAERHRTQASPDQAHQRKRR